MNLLAARRPLASLGKRSTAHYTNEDPRMKIYRYEHISVLNEVDLHEALQIRTWLLNRSRPEIRPKFKE
jgi:hypothetical protein